MAAIRRKVMNNNVHAISKLELIKRLEAVDMFNDALSILKADDLLYEKWSAASEIRQDDVNARALFLNLNLDPDVMLGK